MEGSARSITSRFLRSTTPTPRSRRSRFVRERRRTRGVRARDSEGPAKEEPVVEREGVRWVRARTRSFPNTFPRGRTSNRRCMKRTWTHRRRANKTDDRTYTRNRDRLDTGSKAGPAMGLDLVPVSGSDLVRVRVATGPYGSCRWCVACAPCDRANTRGFVRRFRHPNGPIRTDRVRPTTTGTRTWAWRREWETRTSSDRTIRTVDRTRTSFPSCSWNTETGTHDRHAWHEESWRARIKQRGIRTWPRKNVWISFCRVDGIPGHESA